MYEWLAKVQKRRTKQILCFIQKKINLLIIGKQAMYESVTHTVGVISLLVEFVQCSKDLIDLIHTYLHKIVCDAFVSDFV